MAHDACIVQKAAYVLFGEGGYFLRREAGECRAEGNSFVKDGPPGEAGLKDLKREPLKMSRVGFYGHAPFLVMIFREERALLCPGATAGIVGGLFGFFGHIGTEARMGGCNYFLQIVENFSGPAFFERFTE